MKKILGLSFLFLAATTAMFQLLELPEPIPSYISTTPNISPSPVPSRYATGQENLKTVSVDGHNYRFALTPITNPENLYLYSNFPEKNTAKELALQQSCQILVNGGFYDTSDNHLGWLVSEKILVSPNLKSDLFNGYLALSAQNHPTISPLQPDSSVRAGVQTGPLLLQSSKLQKLAIKNDAQRRRMVAAIDSNQQLWFVAVIGEETFFSGPLLSDLPKIIAAIGEREQLHFTAAINLDGGSASSFISPNLSLTEMSPIGSYFCYRP